MWSFLIRSMVLCVCVVVIIGCPLGGVTTWTRVCGPTGADVGGESVLQTSAGGDVLVGSANTEVTKTDVLDMYLVLVDSNGNVDDELFYGGALDQQASCVAPTGDGGSFAYRGLSGVL